MKVKQKIIISLKGGLIGVLLVLFASFVVSFIFWGNVWNTRLFEGTFWRVISIAFVMGAIANNRLESN